VFLFLGASAGCREPGHNIPVAAGTYRSDAELRQASPAAPYKSHLG